MATAHHLEQLLRGANEFGQHSLLPGITHHCTTVTIQSKYQPAHQTGGLPRPPNFSLRGETRSSAHRGPGLHVLTDLWAHVPTHPLVLQNSTPTSTLAAMGAHSKGHLGELARYYSLPLTSSHTQQCPQTVTSTHCAQGTCLSLKININKPLYSFILLSLQV